MIRSIIAVATALAISAGSAQTWTVVPLPTAPPVVTEDMDLDFRLGPVRTWDSTISGPFLQRKGNNIYIVSEKILESIPPYDMTGNLDSNHSEWNTLAAAFRLVAKWHCNEARVLPWAKSREEALKELRKIILADPEHKLPTQFTVEHHPKEYEEYFPIKYGSGARFLIPNYDPRLVSDPHSLFIFAKADVSGRAYLVKGKLPESAFTQ
jgi:hypothetical protein